MKEYRINFSNLVRQLLPAHKRQPVRLRILRCLVAPLIALYNLFVLWRNEVRKLLNVSCRAGILTHFLRNKYNDPSITIKSYRENGIAVGLYPEGKATARSIGGDEEEGTPCAVPLRGERRQQFGDVDFIVYIAITTDLDAVRADVERYRPALTTYKIIQR